MPHHFHAAREACTRCHNQKKKCIAVPDTSFCDRCQRLGVSDLCDIGQSEPIPILTKPTACSRCRRQRKKCVMGPLACERCVRLGVERECIRPDNNYSVPDLSQSDEPDPVPPALISAAPIPLLPVQNLQSMEEIINVDGTTTSKSSSPSHYHARSSLSPSLLHHFMDAMESPIVDSKNSDWSMEDADLMPTFSDWLLVYNYLTNNGTEFPVSAEFDAERLLQNYFQKCAVLRLILCCWAVTFSHNPGEEVNSAMYFSRARKALLRSDLSPSADLVKAYSMIYSHALYRDQPAIGRPFLRNAMEMILELKLDEDPDTLPWLNHLSIREKEELRRVFYICYYYYCLELSTSPDAFHLPVSGHKVNQPIQIYDPNPIFVQLNTMKWVSELRNVIGSAKQLFSSPPPSIPHLLNPTTTSHLQNRLLSIQSSIPPEFIWHFTSPFQITLLEIPTLIAQVRTLQDYLKEINTLYYSTISVLTRPILFLTTIPPPRFTPSQQTTITAASTRCIESAWRFSAVWVFLEYMSTGPGSTLLVDSERGFFGNKGLLYPVWECCIVFWFVACKMDPAWRAQIYGNGDDGEAVRRMKGMVGKLKDGKAGGAAVPIVDGIEGMIFEMEECLSGIRRGVTVNAGETGLELGMKVMTIGGTRVDEDSPISEPYCFLGLLGFEIGNNIRWKGRKEESWRLFWKLNS